MTERRTIDPITGEVIDDPPIRPFADFLREQSSGKTHDELSEALWDLVSRCKETGKKGTLTFVVSVELAKEAGVLIVSDEIKLRLPEFPRDGSIYWADRTGNLSRQNPAQPELSGLRDVSAQTQPDNLREVN